MEKKKDEKWIKPRHRIVRNIVFAVMSPYIHLKYNIKVAKFKEQRNRQYLILLNHQTPFDQFFVGMSFSGPVYYLATEDIFSMGKLSDLIRWLIAPIPIKKQTVDVTAIRSCLQVVREGGTLAIAPEGNRTYSGKTEYMNSSIAALAKKLDLPIALYRIEGGYGAEPRWSDVVRRGKMKAYVSEVIEPCEYKDLTNDELFKRISDGLYVNEAVADSEYDHKRRAEYLERAMYVCPYCGLSVFESDREKIHCTKCGSEIIYKPTKELEGVGHSFPFRFVNDWYEYQKDFINSLDLTPYSDTPMYTDTADISEVIVRKRKNPLRDNALIKLYGDRITVDGDMVLPFDEISVVTVLGRNKLNIYHGKTVYQIKGSKRFNALKYVNIFYRHKNVQKGDNDGKFLGI